ncbi:MAG: hypothetical protein H6822_02070 [Planctomycetaceae bacterium]|nr:hypothetical protein [Planctomycetales bacterium]MCB9920936.1 hypothetical protein [Planctomycetaceae bacterium]
MTCLVMDEQQLRSACPSIELQQRLVVLTSELQPQLAAGMDWPSNITTASQAVRRAMIGLDAATSIDKPSVAFDMGTLCAVISTLSESPN